MILVDTSVWVDHLRHGEARLADLLNDSQVLMHNFVLGELACGRLSDRIAVLKLLGDLPRAPMASDEEVLFFIERHSLPGRGIGYIDAHLLAATSLGESGLLWTRDRRLGSAAGDLGLAWSE